MNPPPNSSTLPPGEWLLPKQAGDTGWIPGSERSSGEVIGYPLQYSWASLVAQMVKKSACVAGDLGSTPCNPMDYSLPGSSVHGDSPGKNTGVGCHASPGHLPDLGTEPRSPTLQADSLPSEPAGKPMNTGVGSLSLLQGIFLTQESNQGFLHCSWILYQLSYQGSPVDVFN